MGILDLIRRRRETRYILSIDGGGMRGIIPSCILGKMAQYLIAAGDTRTFYSPFDLIAGTSTGALLALGLSMPADGTVLTQENLQPFRTKKGFVMPGPDPQAFTDIYRLHGPEIFPRSSARKNILYPILNDKYDARPYEKFLRSIFGDTMLEEARVPTVLTSYSTTAGSIYLLRSWDSHGIRMSEAARASSAAPMYFPPAEITEDKSGRKHVLIDGGVAANNPALIAYSEARKLYPEAGKFHILSLSTCAPRFSFDPSDGPGGLTGWARVITKIYGEAQTEVADTVAPEIDGLTYTRIWAPVLARKIKLDETTDESISMLMDAAEKTYEANEEKITSFLSAVAGERTHESVRLYRSEESPEGLFHMLLKS